MLISRPLDEPRPTAVPTDELGRLHHAWLRDLQARKILVGSGPMREGDGERRNGGIVIVRAADLGAAQNIAAQEPYRREGQRTIEVLPWQRTWWDD